MATCSYILNRGWIDHSLRRVPTYNEITAESPSKYKSKRKHQSEHDAQEIKDESDMERAQGNVISEDEFDEVAEQFETSYNFRFEEPCALPSSETHHLPDVPFPLVEMPRQSKRTPVRLRQLFDARTRLAKRPVRSAKRVRRKSCSRNARRSNDSRH
jgi:hypothetical protein